MADEHDLNKQCWLGRARRLQWRVNANWWLERFWPLALALSVIFACLFLWARREGIAVESVWVAFGCGLGAIGLAALWWARPHFLSSTQALVRLEEIHGLHNRLSAASAGVGPWPNLPEKTQDGWSQRWERVGAPLLLAIGLLTTAVLLPLPDAQAVPSTQTQEPLAWTQIDSWLDTLQQEDAISPESVEAFQKRLDELRERPSQDWYGHGSLEAGENLREQAAQSIQQLQRDLAAAESSLDGLSSSAGSGSDSIRELGAQFGAATDALGAGNLPLSNELLKQMRQLDASQLKTMDAKKMAQLREKLAKAQKACSQCQGGGLSKEAMQAAWVSINRNKPAGTGGVMRGPGAVPFQLMADPSAGEEAQIEGLSNEDFERAALGDALGTTAQAHNVDTTTGPDGANAGQAAEAGSGGEAVWRQSLTPRESHVLERFFK